MYKINISNKYANQRVNFSFDGKNYALQFRNTKDDLTLVDVYIDNILIQAGAMCVPDAPIIKYNYLAQGGNFYFHCLNYDYPNYKQFGVTQTLYYLPYGEKYPFEYEIVKPKKYLRELNYLESNGTQYIDTGVILNSSSRVRIEFPAEKPMTPPTTADFSAFGCVGGVDAKYQLFNIIQGATRYTYGNAFQQISHSGVIAAEMTGAHFALTKVDGTIVERDVAYSTPFVCASTAFIFANNDGVGNAQYKGALAVSRCRIWQDGVTLTKDFIPVVDLDNNPRMFDLVSEKYPKHFGEFLYE